MRVRDAGTGDFSKSKQAELFEAVNRVYWQLITGLHNTRSLGQLYIYYPRSSLKRSFFHLIAKLPCRGGMRDISIIIHVIVGTRALKLTACRQYSQIAFLPCVPLPSWWYNGFGMSEYQMHAHSLKKIASWLFLCVTFLTKSSCKQVKHLSGLSWSNVSEGTASEYIRSVSRSSLTLAYPYLPCTSPIPPSSPCS